MKIAEMTKHNQSSLMPCHGGRFDVPIVQVAFNHDELDEPVCNLPVKSSHASWVLGSA